MENAPATASATVNCGWCSKPMPADAVKCPSCGKVTKQIYYQKIICYVFCLSGGLLMGFGITNLTKKKPAAEYYDYFNQNAGSSGGSSGTIMLIAGILLGLVGTYYWYMISKKLGTYKWR